MEKTCQCIMLIFGASGDLTKRKLIPALYELDSNDLLHPNFKVIGISRREKSNQQFRDEMKNGLKEFLPSGNFDKKICERLSERLFYQSGSITDADSLNRLSDYIKSLQNNNVEPDPLIYLALPPSTIAEGLKVMKSIDFISTLGGEAKALVEKPFGRDVKTAEELNQLLAQQFDESRIYRIDHYLAKDTVRNLMIFRFANAIFEPLWNRNYIDHIQITAAETIGVEGRGGFYEDSGIVRDMLQNHVMQVLSLIAMEPPLAGNDESIREKKTEIFQSIEPILKNDFAFGQYEGYRDETNVDPKSLTPTFVALRLLINNWRWHDVPFYIRTGKNLAKKVSEVIVQFKRVPLCIFSDEKACQNVHPNKLIIRLQPDEGIKLSFTVRVPGMENDITESKLGFDYKDLCKPTSGGYEQVILDGMRGKPSLFWNAKGIEASWRVVTPLLDVPVGTEFPNYKPGTWGPEAASKLIQKDGRKWLS